MKKLKAVMTLVIRDEEDIIAQNLEFHKAFGVDHFLIYDHLSSDRTTEILKKYQEKGWVTFFSQESPSFAQDVWMTDLARKAHDIGADWVIPNDADEFWMPENGQTLKKILASTKADVLVVDRSNFIPIESSDETSFMDRMIYRERSSLNTLGKPLPPKVCFRSTSDTRVAFGSHRAQSTQYKESNRSNDLLILHYPYRSIDQLRSQIRNGINSLNRNQIIGRGINDTWRKLYEMDLNGKLEEFLSNYSVGLDEKLSSGELIRDERIRNFFALLQIGTFT